MQNEFNNLCSGIIICNSNTQKTEKNDKIRKNDKKKKKMLKKRKKLLKKHKNDKKQRKMIKEREKLKKRHFFFDGKLFLRRLSSTLLFIEDCCEAQINA